MSFVACPSGNYPRLGSLCRVRVQLKANIDETESSVPEGNEKPSVQPDQPLAEAVETAFPRNQDTVLQVPLGDWTILKFGVGQCDVTEACLERMRAGEKCEVRVTRVLSRILLLYNFQSYHQTALELSPQNMSDSYTEKHFPNPDKVVYLKQF